MEASLAYDSTAHDMQQKDDLAKLKKGPHLYLHYRELSQQHSSTKQN